MAKKIAVNEILICDDSPQTRLLLKTVFSTEGFFVLEAEDGVSAQELAEKHIPDLIIMDVVMPGQDGITTIKNLHSNAVTSNIPIIVITGKPSIIKLLGEAESQIVSVIEKPFPLKTVKEKVAEIFDD